MHIRWVDFNTSYTNDFVRLNKAWMEEFELDGQQDPELIDPLKNVIEKGGRIILIEHDNSIIGTIALLNKETGSYEIAKLAVDKKFRGNGIGERLFLKALQVAKDDGKKRINLESSTKLKAAISLYHKHGFKEIDKTSINCCDLRMELLLP